MNKKEEFEEIFKGDSEKSSSKIAFKLKDDSEKNTEDTKGKSDKWQVLIVDDEESIHTVTRFALKNFVFQGKTIEFLDAYSAEEAKQLIEKNPNVAVVLLDVVMEEKHAGLKLIKIIREKIKNKYVRIVLRTGYPGEAPEREVIDSYSIDDYKVKTELTAEKLYSVVLACLRTYEIIRSLLAQSELLRYIVDQKTKELLEYQNKLEDKISERTKELEDTNINLEDEIDKHKRTEASLKESEEKFRDMSNLLPQIVYEIDIYGNLTFVNKQAFDFFGYSQEEFKKGINVLQTLIPEDRDRAKENIQNVLYGKDVGNSEYTALRKDGRTFQILIYANAILKDNKPVGLRGIIVDITERKQAEEALTKSEEKYRLISENSYDIVCLLINDKIEYICPAFERLSGYKANEFYNNYLSFLHPDDVEAHIANVKYNNENKIKNAVRTERYLFKDGKFHWFENNIRNEYKDDGTIITTIIARDITERKQAEEELIASEERFRSIFSNISNIAVQGYDKDRKVTFWNKASEKLYGYSRDEALNKQLEDLIIPLEMREIIISWIHNWHENDIRIPNGELVLMKKDKSPVQVYSSHVMIESANGEKEMFCIDIDITERKQAEEELRISKMLLRDVMDLVPAFICAKNLDGRIILVNKKLTDFYGTTVEEMTGMLHADLCEDENELRAMLAADREVIESGKPKFIPEETMKHPDGSISVIETYKIPFTAHSEPAVLIAAADITERKQAEETLRESEEKFRDMSNLLPQIVYEIDIYGNLTFVNKQAFDFFGYSQEEFKKGINVLQTLIPEDRDRAKENIQNVLYGKDVGNSEYTALRKDGRTFQILIYASAILKDNKPVGLRGIIVDITERKQAEEVVKRSEERLALALEGTGLGSWDHNYKTGEIVRNERWAEILGYTLDEIKPSLEFWKGLIHPDDLQRVIELMEYCEAGKMQYFKAKYRMKTRSDEWKWILDWGKIVERDKNSKPLRAAGTHLDITESKQAEEILLKSERRLKNAQELSKIGDYEWELNTAKIIWSDGLYKLFGFSIGSHITNEKLFKQIHPDDLELNIKNMKKWFKEGGGEPYEYRIIHADGAVRNMYEECDVVYNEKGKVEKLFGVVHDITERKQTEERLREYSKSQAILIKEINHRVRNNLTAIIGMLYSEQELAERKGKLEYLSNIHNIIMRIKGLSTVHSMISESKWKPLKITHLCERIVNEVIKSLSSSKDVNLLVTSSDFLIGSNKAHYLGMVINELATNSIKYALNKRDKLNINIDIKEEDDNIVLNYRDDGPGYPRKMFKEGFSVESIGYELIQGIVKHSLLGDLELKNDNGAVTIITFKNIQ